MALTYGFFNSVNGDRTYDADDISNYFLKLISNGVFATPSTAMQVTATGTDMTVQVSAGWAFVNCKWLQLDAPYVLTIDAADVVYNRYDRIVIRLDPITNRNISIYVKKGTPASSPVVPTLERTDGGVWELSLAYVHVGAGVTEIRQMDIADERGNADVCGYVTGLIDQIDTTNLFAQYDDAFSEWFSGIKESLSTATLIRQYTSSYTTKVANEQTIPINISVYNEDLDVLNVYINGLKLIQGVDYTKSTATVTLSDALSVVGTSVEFEVLKSVDGSDAESVIDMVYQLQTQMGSLMANTYVCNGVNDNVKLMQWLQSWQLTSGNNCIARIIGNFGCSSQLTNNAYFSFMGSTSQAITLDFTNCSVVKPPSGYGFAVVSNCKVKGLKVLYDDRTNASTCIGILANTCTLEDCDIYGVINGTSDVIAYNLINCRAIECDSSLTAYGMIQGIVASNSIVTCCNITVESLGSATSAYGINISDASRCDNSTFVSTAATSSTSASACGGYGGGYYSNCVFVGAGGLKGQGFYVTANQLLNVNNCIFRGYTEDSENGWGIGITGAANSDGITLFLTGINCNQIPKDGYSQTGSLVFTSGHGSYMGCFWTAVNVVSTIVSYGRVIRNRV